MKVTADTNILVRALTGDDPRQARVAQDLLADAELVALPTVCLAELAWVLTSGYRLPRTEIASTLRQLTDATNVAVDRQSVEAGLSMLEAGGDFTDGVIVHEGAWLGGEMFVSFDRRAVARARSAGVKTRLLRDS